jgi:hypothetical protein
MASSHWIALRVTGSALTRGTLSGTPASALRGAGRRTLVKEKGGEPWQRHQRRPLSSRGVSGNRKWRREAAREGWLSHCGELCRQQAQASELAEKIRLHGGRAITVPADVAQPAVVGRMFDTTEKDFGGADVPTKAAVETLTAILSKELRGRSIRLTLSPRARLRPTSS